MLPSLNPAIAQLRLIPVILRAADPSLWNHLSETQPFFALSGTLTMYAHDITRLGEIARLFDVLLAREPVFSVYMFARIVLDRREELFDIPATEPEMLHSMLSKLPKSLDLDALIVGTVALFDAHPPETLGAAWRVGISSASVLKTARKPEQSATQTMEEGQRFFEKQVKELDWQEKRDRTLATLWKYRRPARTIGLALFVGALAVWLRRSPAPAALLWTLVARFRR
jgi:TBC1 domain family member 20